MTVKDVEDAVVRIKEAVGDNETAHGLEDDLHKKVLDAIASGKAVEPQRMATLALSTRQIHFVRWYA